MKRTSRNCNFGPQSLLAKVQLVELICVDVGSAERHNAHSNIYEEHFESWTGAPRACHAGCMLQRHFDGLLALSKIMAHLHAPLAVWVKANSMKTGKMRLYIMSGAWGKRSGACRASARGRRERRAEGNSCFLKVLIAPRHGNQYGIE